jgi:hypothetical protein
VSIAGYPPGRSVVYLVFTGTWYSAIFAFMTRPLVKPATRIAPKRVGSSVPTAENERQDGKWSGTFARSELARLQSTAPRGLAAADALDAGLLAILADVETVAVDLPQATAFDRRLVEPGDDGRHLGPDRGRVGRRPRSGAQAGRYRCRRDAAAGPPRRRCIPDRVLTGSP